MIHHLYDAFSERLLYIGAQYPARQDGEVFAECPKSAEEEVASSSSDGVDWLDLESTKVDYAEDSESEDDSSGDLDNNDMFG